MLIVGHTAIGIATGLLVPQPAAAFALGVLSHHLADLTPHFDAGSFMKPRELADIEPLEYGLREWLFVIIDVALTITLVALLANHVPVSRWGAVFFGMLGANLPDLVHHVPFWNKPLRKIGWIKYWHDQIHYKYHSTVPARLWYVGVATQLTVILVTIWLVHSGGY